MTTQRLPELRSDFPGTLPEMLVFSELVRRGLKPDLDFFFQSSIFGGRMAKGGLVIDFIFENPPGLAINVQGEFWHRGAVTDARDLLGRAQLAGEGITLIFVDETDLYQDARYFVGEALAFRDHSRQGRGG